MSFQVITDRVSPESEFLAYVRHVFTPLMPYRNPNQQQRSTEKSIYLVCICRICILVHGQVNIIFVVSVCLSVFCLFVCLFVQSFSQPSLIQFRSNLDICYMSVICPVEYRGCATPGGWVTPKNLYFWGFWGSKTISFYSFDRIVLIFGYIVERTNTKILSSHFLQFPS